MKYDQVKEVLAIIPAREGSKGVYKKNITELNGKPLIAYSIIPALLCKGISRVVVSTDSEEIAAIARQFGADVPFLRPSRLGGDKAKLTDVIFDTLDKLYELEGYEPDAYMLIMPCYPFKTKEDLLRMVETMNIEGAISCSISSFLNDKLPGWLMVEEGKLVAPKIDLNGSEKLGPILYDSGNFTLVRSVPWKKVHSKANKYIEFARIRNKYLSSLRFANKLTCVVSNIEYNEFCFFEIDEKHDLAVARKIFEKGMFNA